MAPEEATCNQIFTSGGATQEPSYTVGKVGAMF